MIPQEALGLRDGIVVVDGREGLRFDEERSVGIDGNYPIGSHGAASSLRLICIAPRCPHRFCFTVSPSSIRRRMASDLAGLSGSRSDHSSILSLISGGMRNAIMGSLPVAGRPRRLGNTFFVDFAMVLSHT